MTVNLERLRFTLVALYFVFAPFTWSSLTSVSGLLVRPTDLFLLSIIALTLHRGTIGRVPVVAVLPFLLVSALLFVRGGLTSDLGQIVSGIKIGYYAVGCACMADTITSATSRFVRSYRGVVFAAGCLVVFLCFLAASGALGVLLSLSVTSPTSAVFVFMNQIFQTNLFGATRAEDVLGLQYRNSMAVGILAASLFFAYSAGRWTGTSIALFILAAASMSRSVWLVQVLLISLMFLAAPLRIRLGLIVLAIPAAIVLLQSEVVSQVVLDRASSSSGGRLEMIDEALGVLNQYPFGAPNGADIVLANNDEKTVHNVPVAMGLELGFIGLFISVAIGFAALGIFVRFLVIVLTDRSRTWTATLALVGAAATVTIRPMVSASFENYFTVGGWGLAALVIAGIASHAIPQAHATDGILAR